MKVMNALMFEAAKAHSQDKSKKSDLLLKQIKSPNQIRCVAPEQVNLHLNICHN